MGDSPSMDRALGVLTPADLQRRVTLPGIALVCAEPGRAGSSPEVLSGMLRGHGWSSSSVTDPDRAQWLASVRRFDTAVIIGSSVNWITRTLAGIRSATTAPILVLAGCELDAHPRLFESGADMVTGLSANEPWLLAAITALVRRNGPSTPILRYLECEGLRLDVLSHEAWLDDEECKLSSIEFRMLQFLMSHPQLALPHQTIVKAVWNWKYSNERNALRIHINRLRKKLGDTAAEPRFIRSLRGFGYSFVLPVSQFAADTSVAGVLGADSTAHALARELRSLRAGLLTAASPAAAVSFLVESVVSDGLCDGAAVFARDADGDSTLQLLSQAGMPAAWQAAVGQGIPLASGFVAADTVLSGRIQHFADLSELGRRYSATARLLKDADMPVMLSIPLVDRRQVWGHMGFSAHAGSAFSAGHLMLFESVSYLLGALARSGGLPRPADGQVSA